MAFHLSVEVGSIAVQVVDLSGMDLAFKTSPNPATKPERVDRAQPDVLVHVEQFHCLPVNLLLAGLPVGRRHFPPRVLES
jgi:hypothetical protein